MEGGKHLKKTRKPRIRLSFAMMTITVFSVLLLALIGLTILFYVSNAKYGTVHATARVQNEGGRNREVTVIYVVEGKGYSAPFERAPKKWKNDDLVKIEYREDDPETIRLKPSGAPFVIGYIFGSIGLVGGIWLHIRPKIRSAFDE
jgi:hypothetical protein